MVLHWAFGGLQTKPSFASPLLVVVTAAVRHRRFLGWLPVAVAATIVATVSATPVTLVASLVLGRLRYGLLSASLTRLLQGGALRPPNKTPRILTIPTLLDSDDSDFGF